MSEFFPSLTCSMSERFRGYLPVVIDVETAGFDPQTNALLEIGACLLSFDDDGRLKPDEIIDLNVQPFEGSVINQASCEFIKVDPFDPQRNAICEKEAVKLLCKKVSARMKQEKCTRAIIVAHNAGFDHGFISAAVSRTNYKRSPFHPFSSLDTATLSAVFYGQTVLEKACQTAGVEYDSSKAHGAKYDATVTAELFCTIVNNLKNLNNFNLPLSQPETYCDEINHEN